MINIIVLVIISQMGKMVYPGGVNKQSKNNKEVKIFDFCTTKKIKIFR